MLSNPVFIIGTERSGSNLLRLMLNAHPRLVIPHPPHILRDMTPLLRHYGDIERPAQFAALANDLAQVVNLHFAPWPFQVTGEDLVKRSESKSLYGLYAALYDTYAEFAHKPRWGCKSTFMYQQIATILENHQSPQFIHLVRDPRDVAASASESVFSKFHPYKEAELWLRQQSEIEGWKLRLSRRQIHTVRYEDLTASPSETLRQIMAFLEEEFHPHQLEHFKTKEATELAGLSASWKEVGNPTHSKSVGRFRVRLLARDVELVEYLAGDLMRQYGYELEHASRPSPPSFQEMLRIEVTEHLKKIETESKALFADRNFSRRWKRWAFLRYVETRRSLFHV